MAFLLSKTNNEHYFSSLYLMSPESSGNLLYWKHCQKGEEYLASTRCRYCEHHRLNLMSVSNVLEVLP